MIEILAQLGNYLCFGIVFVMMLIVVLVAYALIIGVFAFFVFYTYHVYYYTKERRKEMQKFLVKVKKSLEGE